MAQNADGTPHITFYDKDRLLSFVWDGKSPLVEISHGGYGEPVWFEMGQPDLSGAFTLGDVMEVFAASCAAWATEVYDLEKDG